MPIGDTGSTHYCFSTVDPLDYFTFYYIELTTSAPYAGVFNVLKGLSAYINSIDSKISWTTKNDLVPFGSTWINDTTANKWFVI